MKNCKNCGHEIRKIKGKFLHRKEHSKYSGVQSGGVTFSEFCGIRDYNFNTETIEVCQCRNPQVSNSKKKK